MTISACIIMKNEQQVVLRMLNSIQKHVDEIIVVDTGSTDQSVAIVEKAGIKVYQFEWTNSFAEARNYSLSLATSDWIFWIDCDEELIVPDQYSLKDHLLEIKEETLGKCLIANLVSDTDSSEAHYIMPQYRLFKRSENYQYVNAIHEHIYIDDEVKELKSFNMKWMIKHYGYLQSVVDEKNKSERNISLITHAISDGDNNPWLFYHLASEYYRLQLYKEAFELVNAAIQLFLDKQQYPPSLLYKMKYDILIATASYDSILQAIPLALQLYPDYADLYFYQAISYYALKKYDQAIEAFNTCLTIENAQMKYLTLDGISSYRSYYYLSLCYEAVGDAKNAGYYRLKNDEIVKK